MPRHNMSIEARRKIGAAQRARWARQKAATVTNIKPVGLVGRIKALEDRVEQLTRLTEQLANVVGEVADGGE